MGESSDCRKAGAIIDRYMDGCATEPEAVWLNAHIARCGGCLADFRAYDQMLSAFAETGQDNAPDGFEAAVLSKIAVCGKVYPTRAALADKVSSVLWTAVSLVLGAGLLTAVWSDQLLALCAGGGLLADYAAFISPFAAAVRSAWTQVSGAANAAFALLERFAETNAVPLSVAAGVIFIAYAVSIMDRDKNAAPAEKTANVNDAA